jgi:hypothetical protein
MVTAAPPAAIAGAPPPCRTAAAPARRWDASGPAQARCTSLTRNGTRAGVGSGAGWNQGQGRDRTRAPFLVGIRRGEQVVSLLKKAARAANRAGQADPFPMPGHSLAACSCLIESSLPTLYCPKEREGVGGPIFLFSPSMPCCPTLPVSPSPPLPPLGPWAPGGPCCAPHGPPTPPRPTPRAHHGPAIV